MIDIEAEKENWQHFKLLIKCCISIAMKKQINLLNVDKDKLDLFFKDKNFNINGMIKNSFINKTKILINIDDKCNDPYVLNKLIDTFKEYDIELDFVCFKNKIEEFKKRYVRIINTDYLFVFDLSFNNYLRNEKSNHLRERSGRGSMLYNILSQISNDNDYKFYYNFYDIIDFFNKNKDDNLFNNQYYLLNLKMTIKDNFLLLENLYKTNKVKQKVIKI